MKGKNAEEIWNPASQISGHPVKNRMTVISGIC